MSHVTAAVLGGLVNRCSDDLYRGIGCQYSRTTMSNALARQVITTESDAIAREVIAISYIVTPIHLLRYPYQQHSRFRFVPIREFHIHTHTFDSFPPRIYPTHSAKNSHRPQQQATSRPYKPAHTAYTHSHSPAPNLPHDSHPSPHDPPQRDPPASHWSSPAWALSAHTPSPHGDSMNPPFQDPSSAHHLVRAHKPSSPAPDSRSASLGANRRL